MLSDLKVNETVIIVTETVITVTENYFSKIVRPTFGMASSFFLPAPNYSNSQALG